MSTLQIESIQFRMAGTAAWRRGLASKYKDDLRNGRAAERLDALARADANEVTKDVQCRN